MILRRFFMLLLCLFFGVRCLGQDRGIRVGERLPNVSVSRVLNAGSGLLRLRDFRGKVVLIDFWATSCGSCVAALPRLDSLERSFGGRLVVLAVSYEREAVVRAFLGRHRLGLRVAWGDTLLGRLFPHRFLSHEVWVDPGGMVAAVTDPDYVDGKNVGALLRGEKLELPAKADIDFDYGKALAGWLPHSVVLPYVPGALRRVGVVRNSVSGVTRLYAVNTDVLHLALLGLHRMVNWPRSRMVAVLRDPERVFRQAGMYPEAWNREHGFCYEAVLPGQRELKDFREGILSDLERFFGVSARMEVRPVDGWSLERVSGIGRDNVRAGDGLAGDSLVVQGPVSDLAWALEHGPGGRPVTDRSGFSGQVGEVAADTAALRDVMRKNGLVLRPETVRREVLVLTDQ